MRDAMWKWAVVSDRIVWLAAYPRSGVTMLRHLFLSCFGLRSDSLYNDEQISRRHGEMLNAVPEDKRAREEITGRQGLLPVKTHHLVPKGPLAIALVRDGRTALQSLCDFYAEMCWRTESLTDLITGKQPWGDWSAWLRAWRKRPNTMWVRYEDMRADFKSIVSQIASWIGREPIAYSMPSFTELNEAHPFFFRKGNRTSQWGAAEDELFWSRHGEMMNLLGYEKE